MAFIHHSLAMAEVMFVTWLMATTAHILLWDNIQV